MAEEYVCAVGVEPGENAKVEDGLCNLSHGSSKPHFAGGCWNVGGIPDLNQPKTGIYVVWLTYLAWNPTQMVCFLCMLVSLTWLLGQQIDW